MKTKPNCSLEDAVNMVYGFTRTRSWEWAIAHVAHVTGWSVGKLEAAIEQAFNAYCEQYGYDYP